MISYLTLGTNDLERSGAFYDGIAKILGHGRLTSTDRMIMWGTPGNGAMLCSIKPYDEKGATGGNGTMAGLGCADHDQVQEVYNYALANGGSDEGAPGERTPQFYGAYFRDPDGNKLVAYHMEMG